MYDMQEGSTQLTVGFDLTSYWAFIFRAFGFGGMSERGFTGKAKK